MKHTKCKICGKEHALGGCPEFRQRVNGHSQHEGANAQVTVRNEVVTVVGTESGTLTPPKPKIGRPRTGFNKKEYNRQFTADLRTIRRLGLNVSVSEYRKQKESEK